jgi:hypothetical protein
MKLFGNTEANVTINRVSVENQVVNTVILIKSMYWYPKLD